jgi:DNA-binding transcriptional ArsR family regulator
MSPNPDNLLAALNHPLRRRILRALDDRKTASPAELAKSLAEPLTKVSYHVRILAERGALAPVGTRSVRGAVEHFYSSIVEAEWARSALRASQQVDDPSGVSPG